MILLRTLRLDLMMKTKDDILTALETNLPQQLKKIKTEVAQTEIVADTEEDYVYSRDKIKELISKAEEAIDNMMALASETEHPRAFEVLAGMFKTTTDMMDQLITLQKKRKELTQSEEHKASASGSTTNNAIFVGSTTELQKFLSKSNDID
jgi:predicted phage tail protein